MRQTTTRGTGTARAGRWDEHGRSLRLTCARTVPKEHCRSTAHGLVGAPPPETRCSGSAWAPSSRSSGLGLPLTRVADPLRPQSLRGPGYPPPKKRGDPTPEAAKVFHREPGCEPPTVRNLPAQGGSEAGLGAIRSRTDPKRCRRMVPRGLMRQSSEPNCVCAPGGTMRPRSACLLWRRPQHKPRRAWDHSCQGSEAGSCPAHGSGRLAVSGTQALGSCVSDLCRSRTTEEKVRKWPCAWYSEDWLLWPRRRAGC